MQIKMKRTEKGSPDGISVNLYEEGIEYDVPEELARAFFAAEFAEHVIVGGWEPEEPATNEQEEDEEEPPAPAEDEAAEEENPETAVEEELAPEEDAGPDEEETPPGAEGDEPKPLTAAEKRKQYRQNRKNKAGA
jgi:hypothetical protein